MASYKRVDGLAEQTFLEIDWRKFTFRQSINKKRDWNFPNLSSYSGDWGFERRSRSGNTFEIKHLFIPATAHSILTPSTSNREEFAEQTFLEIDRRKFTFRQSINKKGDWKISNLSSQCGSWRIRTADPLLVRQMLWTSWAKLPKCAWTRTWT